jgi:hypothetical protein
LDLRSVEMLIAGSGLMPVLMFGTSNLGGWQKWRDVEERLSLPITVASVETDRRRALSKLIAYQIGGRILAPWGI